MMVTRPSLHLEDQNYRHKEPEQVQNLSNSSSPTCHHALLQVDERSSEGAPESPRKAAQSTSTGPLGDSLSEDTVPTEEINVEEEGNHAENVPKSALEVVSRVSAYPRSHSWGKHDLAPQGHGVPAPPEWLWRRIASDLRRALNLTLFNFDLIVPLEPSPRQAGLVLPASPAAEEGLVHLIDINYFPGIEKLPNYEELLVRFFDRLREQSLAQI